MQYDFLLHRLLQPESGYTLVELVAVIFIAGLLMAIAVPSYSELKDSFERSNFINQVEGDIRRARSSAQANGIRNIITLDATGSSYSLGSDSLPVSETATPDIVYLTRSYSTKNTLNFSTTPIFDSRGFVIDSNGELSTITVLLSRNGEIFCSGTIYPIGVFLFSC
ncbi:MAG: prepilin-type N-terminal cleavage/methylation domain-containing protein [Bdellovibrionales bacterium]|nr:prepilin-type N-terminal cleavage/methylation domain-containing protein [Bdellovibrionales bacterium]